MAYSNINKPNEYFNTATWTGNGTSQTINVGFQPDLNWFKNRDAANYHIWIDSVRGINKEIYSNAANAEATDPNEMVSWNSTGYTVGSAGNTNSNGQEIVSWNWLGANGTASNTDGSITSTVSANTTSGFSIVKYTGTGSNATIGHGLGKKPDAIIVKAYENGQQWASYWSPLGATKVMRFNTSDAESTSSTRWNNTEPTSSVFSVGTEYEVNTLSENHIAYCFASIKGFSKIGSYTGNGNSDGTFVYTGFKPAMIILKNASDTYNWEIRDNKRRTYNEANENRLFPNLSNAESVNTETIDFLSNGFKIRNAGGGDNGSGNTIIYMAFAESPFTTSTGIPTTAR